MTCEISVHRPEDDVNPVTVSRDPFSGEQLAMCTECRRFVEGEYEEHGKWLYQLWRDQYDA